MKKISIYCLFIFLIYSCNFNKTEINKKHLNIIYVILDKSSNSFSVNGGYEENFINVDSLYIDNFIEKINDLISNENKTDVILFFNYVDDNINGNKELFLKLESYSKIDTTYNPNGEVISNREAFKKNVLKLKDVRSKAEHTFKNKKKSSLSKLKKMLLRSSKTKGSDCSNLLLLADKKIDNYMVDTSKYVIKNKLIFTFSDLVNFPKKKNKNGLKIKNKIIRPGYTSDVPYLRKSDYINITTQDELDEFLNTIIK